MYTLETPNIVGGLDWFIQQDRITKGEMIMRNFVFAATAACALTFIGCGDKEEDTAVEEDTAAEETSEEAEEGSDEEAEEEAE